MGKNKLENFVMTLPPEAKKALRMEAAERNFANPAQVTSAARIAREIILDHLLAKGLLEKENA